MQCFSLSSHEKGKKSSVLLGLSFCFNWRATHAFYHKFSTLIAYFMPLCIKICDFFSWAYKAICSTLISYNNRGSTFYLEVSFLCANTKNLFCYERRECSRQQNIECRLQQVSAIANNSWVLDAVSTTDKIESLR